MDVAPDSSHLSFNTTWTNSTWLADIRPAAEDGSPLLALLICVPLILLLGRYRKPFVALPLRWSRSLPLRRHLGGRGHYVSVAQSEANT